MKIKELLGFPPTPVFTIFSDVTLSYREKQNPNSLLTAASLKAFSFYPAEMNLRLLFIWEKRKNNKFILLLWWVAIAAVDLFDWQLLVTVI